MTEVFYNNQNPFSGISPAPLVGREQEMIFIGSRWGQVDRFSLFGQITGCNLGFSGMIDRQNQLISGFIPDFKNLIVYQDNISIFSGDYCIVKDINFEESPYINEIPYTISIDCYESGYFSGVFGILDPTEQWDYSEDENGILNLSHTISARGFQNTTQAIENARSFCLDRTGLSGIINPILANNCYNNPYNLLTIQENFDRLNGTYSIIETYNTDLLNSGSGILRYTIDIQSGFEQGINTVNFAGSIDMAKDTSLQHIRNRYKQIDLFSLAFAGYSGITNLNDLQSIPLSSGIVENETEKLLEFNLIFDNNPLPLVGVDYNTTVDYDTVSEITTVSFNSTIFGRGPIKNRWENIYNYYTGIFNGYKLANQDYLLSSGKIYSTYYPLNINPISQSETLDKFNAQINYTAQWNNKKTIPYPFQDWEYSINIKPSILQITPKLSLEENGYYSLIDLNYFNLEESNFQGSFNILRNSDVNQGVSAAQNILNSIIDRYTVPGSVNKKLMENNLTTGDPNQRYITYNVKFKGKPKFGKFGSVNGQSYDFN